MKIVSKRVATMALAAVICIGLAACDKPTAVQSTTPPIDTSAPVSDVPVSTPAEAPSLPWETEPQEELTYGAYFSQRRVYDRDTDIIDSIQFGRYLLTQTGEELHITTWPHDADHVAWVVGPASEYEGCVWHLATPRCAYGVKNGEEIISVDYLSGEQKVLYRDGTGTLAKLTEISSNIMVVAREQVLFFLAHSDSAEYCALHRLYLPTGDVDVLYDRIPMANAPSLRGVNIYSNQEVGWREYNAEFYELMEQYNTPDSPYLECHYASGSDLPQETIAEILREAITLYHQVYPESEYYYNSATEELCRLDYSNSHASEHGSYGRHWQRLCLSPDDIKLHPFTDVEKREILESALSWLTDEYMQRNDIVELKIEKAAFDPISGAVVAAAVSDETAWLLSPEIKDLFGELSTGDALSHFGVVTLTYSTEVDPDALYAYGEEGRMRSVILYREEEGQPWQRVWDYYIEANTPRLVGSAMSDDELVQFNLEDLVAGYEIDNGVYYLFARNEDTGELELR